MLVSLYPRCAAVASCRVCAAHRKRSEDVLNMNFSVDVNMYRENVTSYW
jgi:hypothetical protein